MLTNADILAPERLGASIKSDTCFRPCYQLETGPPRRLSSPSQNSNSRNASAATVYRNRTPFAHCEQPLEPTPATRKIRALTDSAAASDSRKLVVTAPPVLPVNSREFAPATREE